MTSPAYMTRFLLIAAASTLGACSTAVDSAELEPLTGYTEWHRIDSTGPVPGHGDTYRIIYVNDIARTYSHAGPYPIGSIVVKEIRDLADDGSPGDLRYLGVMRKLDQAPSGVELEGGWLFTMADELGDTEVQPSSCWGPCHIQAPIDGAWFDYGR